MFSEWLWNARNLYRVQRWYCENHNSARPDFESVFPFRNTRLSPVHAFFDGTNGYTTTMYVTNTSINPTTAFMDVVSVTNNLITTVPITLGSFRVHNIYAACHGAKQTIGILGTLVVPQSEQ